ncbi:unnamed protein product [Larinioides sclopetarius]|uniref:Arginyl-tRNA--protein transferase 1 n=1 Tax=Larinioides sclopetarius TaxID=280406 RepID=A0AAV1ZG18_9ARAC
MWAHGLTPLDYQNLIDRGWRRSGKYCYKPTMNVTCCPLYTIRCEANKFVLTKSQKKVLKKVHRFLAYGDKSQGSEGALTNKSDQDMEVSFECSQDIDMQSLKRIKKTKTINHSDIKADQTETCTDNQCISDSQSGKCESSEQTTKSSHTVQPSSDTSSPLKSSNLNSRPPCRKAKEIRKERKLQKLLQKGMSEEEASACIKPKTNESKSLEDFLHEPLPSKPAHKLELRLVPSSSDNPLFSNHFEASYSVYKNYQMTVHKDPAEKVTTKQFKRFLVTNPFQQEASSSSPEPSYGSYHQQYWLDGKLIAVAVLDILPYCLSSVYFYYDPDYSFLSLGTYAALREIAFTCELNKIYPDLQYYYMGYYIHSCIKMRYKGQYVPSFLLCPETYIFQPIEKCRPLLDVSKYSRLEEDPTKEDANGVVNLNDVLVLYDKTSMNYPVYKNLNKNADDEDEVREYAKLVGRKCYQKMLLFRE